ncbi:hypothetical protein Tcan_13922 [Toxocara canis]|uniref:Uncharacterized protein n=1 Tax=Toxocara canis TaxID=6265 RepID=A0A0B2W2I4_TOXCA|nr:hypothetical protein Tcan_13922 [Toxocara canis]
MTTIGFGGNKLELYEDESKTILHTVQSAFAILLILLLYILLGALMLHIIVRPTDRLVTAVFINFFYVTTTSSPRWVYVNNPNVWQLSFLCANLFVGCILVCATNVNMGSALLRYVHDMFSVSSTHKQLQLENLTPSQPQMGAVRPHWSNERK